MIDRLFLAHPRSVGESYGGHMLVAFRFGGVLLGSGFACLAHGLCPFLFEHTASANIRRLYDQMVVNRRHGATLSAGGRLLET